VNRPNRGRGALRSCSKQTRPPGGEETSRRGLERSGRRPTRLVLWPRAPVAFTPKRTAGTERRVEPSPANKSRGRSRDPSLLARASSARAAPPGGGARSYAAGKRPLLRIKGHRQFLMGGSTRTYPSDAGPRQGECARSGDPLPRLTCSLSARRRIRCSVMNLLTRS
jgi:hypothetical protein